MDNNGYEKLLNIAKGQKVENKKQIMSPSSMKALDDASEIVYNSKDMEPKQRYAKFYAAIENKLHVTEDNREPLFNMLHSLHPQSPEKSLEFLKDEIFGKMDVMKDKRTQVNWIRDNYYKVPPDFLKELDKRYNTIVRHEGARNLEWSRAEASAEFGRVVKSLDLEGIDADRSIDSYARGLAKAYTYDLLPQVRVDKNTGDLVFPAKDGPRPLTVLPEIEDLHLRFFADNDHTPLAKEALKNPLDSSRQNLIKREKETLENMFNNPEGIPDDVYDNVILDWAMGFVDPAMGFVDPIAGIMEGIKAQTTKAIKRGEAKSFKDITRLWVGYQSRIEDNLLRRAEGHERTS